ncbi:MAG: trypsin-like peptidase domain-containing protein [Alphaproteobacteria bacterium]|nr:trypsin-like peptidase domain-containing protein [Alphaproteobacteria bacterium]
MTTRLHRRAVLALGLGAVAPLVVPRPGRARSGPDSFAPLARQVVPAVVNIAAVRDVPATAQRGDARGQLEEMARRFGQTRRPQAAQRATSLGSGFIIESSGITVTNNHVVEGAREISAIMNNGRTLPAQLLGRDDKTDIAVLKLKTEEKLPFVRWGDSDRIDVGDWVLAVGNPFGLGGTVTAGIVSARGRDLHAGPYDDFLQLDAPINQGNSGGPSFNMDGEVVGVNTAIYSPTGGSVGIGFAIPSNLARQIVDELVRNGRIERGWIGVNIQDITPEIANGLGLKGDVDGVIIAAVETSSPAARAGLRQGDIIVAVNGRRIDQVRDVPRTIAALRPGTDVMLTLLRRGQEVAVPVTTGRLPER